MINKENKRILIYYPNYNLEKYIPVIDMKLVYASLDKHRDSIKTLSNLWVITRKLSYLTNEKYKFSEAVYLTYLTRKYNYLHFRYKNKIKINPCSISIVKSVYEYLSKSEVSRKFISDLINLDIDKFVTKYNHPIYCVNSLYDYGTIIDSRKLSNINQKYILSCGYHRFYMNDLPNIKEFDDSLERVSKSQIKYEDSLGGSEWKLK